MKTSNANLRNTTDAVTNTKELRQKLRDNLWDQLYKAEKNF